MVLCLWSCQLAWYWVLWTNGTHQSLGTHWIQHSLDSLDFIDSLDYLDSQGMAMNIVLGLYSPMSLVSPICSENLECP